MQSFRQWKAMLLLSGALLSSYTLHAQAVYGSIYGTVTDASGAVVPNATITVTDVSKGTAVTVTSNASGDYAVDHLIPDTYNLKVTAAGFEGFEANAIPLHADESPKIDATLKTGSSAQTVTVNADSIPELKTDRADVSTTFNQQDVQDLPVGDRNFTNLQLLLPGAQLLGWAHAPDENPQGSRQIQVDGQAFGGVAFQLDGTDNQDPILGIIVINPNIDSLQETKITTQNFDAEFGKAVSSVVTAQTKSGSNSLHGSLFDYRTSTANLAKDPYLQYPAEGSTPAATLAPGLKNQFGGSIGGKIITDKLFYFGDYQGARQRVGTSSSSVVPTALAESTCTSGGACNLSDYIGTGGAGNGIVYQANGTPYPGNIIPAGQLSAPAINYMKLLAPYAPNKADSNGLVDIYAQGGTGIFNSDQWDARVDYQYSDKIHNFARFSRFTDTLTGKTLFGVGGGPGFGLGGYGGNSKGANDSLAAGTDIAINPTLLTDFRIGYYRYDIGDQKFDEGVDEATNLGFGNLNTSDPITSGLPGFQINQPGGQTEWGAGLNINRCNCPLIEREDQFQVVNNWTKIIRNHSVKIGADLRYARNLRVPSDVDRTGLFTFNNGTTANSSGTGGLALGAYVLGEPGQFGRYVSTSTNAKEFQKRDFFYAQDTWRPTEKLTVNAGLRYEFYAPESVNGKGNGALMNLATGNISVAGYGNIPSDMGWGRDPNTYNPRIGVAYQLNEKTVIRSGYGRSFDMGVFGSIFGHVVTQNLPVLANQEISLSGNATNYQANNGPTGTNALFNLVNGPPSNPPTVVPSNGLLPNPGYAVNTKARPDGIRLPTIDAWNLSVQRSITPSLALTLAYVGNKGTHTLAAGDGNTTNPNEAAIVLPGALSVTGQTLHWDPSVPSTDVVNGFSSISPNGGTSNPTYLTRYYGGSLSACNSAAYAAQYKAAVGSAPPTSGGCGWTQGISYYGDNMDTHFNALQVTVAKQMSHGLSFNANYAWQRGFNWEQNYYTWDPQAGKGRDDSIREQQFVAYGLYTLPFGRNQLVGSNLPGFVNEVIGGWQLSPVVNLSSGLPFSLTTNNCGDSVPQGGQSQVPCYPVGNPGSLQTHLEKFNASAHNRLFYNSVDQGGNSICASSTLPATPAGGFSCPALDTLGTTGRNSNFGPSFFNTDLALQKNFPIHESLFAQFRVDAFNAFNHINAGNPGGNIDSPGTITNGVGGVGVSSPRQLSFELRLQF